MYIFQVWKYLPGGGYVRLLLYYENDILLNVMHIHWNNFVVYLCSLNRQLWTMQGDVSNWAEVLIPSPATTCSQFSYFSNIESRIVRYTVKTVCPTFFELEQTKSAQVRSLEVVNNPILLHSVTLVLMMIIYFGWIE